MYETFAIYRILRNYIKYNMFWGKYEIRNLFHIFSRHSLLHQGCVFLQKVQMIFLQNAEIICY